MTSRTETTKSISDRIEELRQRVRSLAGTIPGLRDKLARAVARGDERQRLHLREQIEAAERDELEIGAAVDHLLFEQRQLAEAEEAERRAERRRQFMDLLDRRHALAVEIDRTMMQLGRQISDLQAVTVEIRRASDQPNNFPAGLNRFAVRNALWHHAKELCKLLQLPAPLGHFTDKRAPLAQKLLPADRREEAA